MASGCRELRLSLPMSSEVTSMRCTAEEAPVLLTADMTREFEAGGA